MASACVNNIVMSPEKFVDCSDSFPSYGRFNPALSSFVVREFPHDRSAVVIGNGGGEVKSPTAEVITQDSDHDHDKDVFDFEFRLDDDPVTMLPADELFFDGKLMPTMRPVATTVLSTSSSSSGDRSPEKVKCLRRIDVSGTDSTYLFSPKAPRCSAKWKEFLGLKKMYQHNASHKQDTIRETSSNNAKSLKHFLHRNSRASHSSSSSSSSDLSLNHPLLKDLDSESVSISSRLSLSSSSSSGHEQYDDLPRLSLDTDKPNLHPIFLLRNTTTASNMNPNPPRVRLVKPRPVNTTGVSIDSPRMNPSGKVVFQNLERSSSSPGSFNGGPRLKHRGMERSYSAHVRVTPLLNVPVCNLRGSSKSGGVFGLFSAPAKKENGGSSGGSNGGSNRNQQSSTSRNRINRV